MLKFQFKNSYLELPESFYRYVSLQSPMDPKLIAFNERLACELKIPSNQVEACKNMILGVELPAGSASVALAYAGHQFGHFSPQLGDGRALLIGEVDSQDGRHYDLVLKGSGQTPFSRGGDGKSPLGPVIREYLLSEAMHALGIATTRALAATATGEMVYRQEFLQGGLFTRVASSHIRVGTFEYFAARRDLNALKLLSKYCIDRHYPSLKFDQTNESYFEFLSMFADKMAQLVASWMSVGFIHGVMNTDNCSLAGETLDYGPCAFVDEYVPDKVYSSIDTQGRYAFSQQARIAQWNLARLADCLSLLIVSEEKAGFQNVEELNAIVLDFPNRFNQCWLEKMRAKMGMTTASKDDEAFIIRWLNILSSQSLDYTNSFRLLASALSSEDSKLQDTEAVGDFLLAWKQHLKHQHRDLESIASDMNQHNPVYIPRNHLVEKAINRSYLGDFGYFERLKSIWEHPYHWQPHCEDLAQGPQESERVLQTFCGT